MRRSGLAIFDDLTLLPTGEPLAEAGFEGFLDGLDWIALLKPSPDPVEVRRLLDRVVEGAQRAGAIV